LENVFNKKEYFYGMVETKETTSENHTKSRDTPNKSEKHEKYSLWLTGAYTVCTFLLLIVAIVALIISINTANESVKIANESVSNAKNAYDLTNYTIQHTIEEQNLLDKQEATEQFGIEMNSIDPLIQNYAYYYFNNFDLKSNGKNVILDPQVDEYLLVNASEKMLTRTPFVLVLHNNTVIDAHVIAVPLNIDKNGNFDVNIKLGDSEHSHYCVLTNPIIPPQLYGDNGVYYIYMHNIPKFDPELAYNINEFYYEITSAEAGRRYIQEYIATQKETQGGYVLENTYFVAYMNMRVNIMKASKLSPLIINLTFRR
jgi:hypothetical protein